MTERRTAMDFVPDPTSGNTTSIHIDAPPEVVWRELEALRPRELRVSRVLMGIRSLPALVRRRGSLRGSVMAEPTLLESMTSSRFVVLHRETGSVLTLGLVGQFWKLSGGADAPIDDADAFVAFDEPGYVKAAIDFTLEARGDGTEVATRTANRATDEAAARRFRRYWRLVGPGSKAIRIEILRALRRRVER